LEPFQKLRIITFLNPGFDPKGAGYNAFQSMIAVGSGQFFGRGLGNRTQSHFRFLPEYHTDFIFATLVEELGALGGTLVYLLYGLLLWRIIRILVRRVVVDDVTYFFSVGLFGMLLTQILINTGMNMGIIPITGITLPFISYGGSSILSICMSFGFFFSFLRMRHEDTA
jgi:rod shape determining protein RodA